MDWKVINDLCEAILEQDSGYKRREALKRVYTLVGLMIENEDNTALTREQQLNALYHIYQNLRVVYAEDEVKALKYFLVIAKITMGLNFKIEDVYAVIVHAQGSYAVEKLEQSLQAVLNKSEEYLQERCEKAEKERADYKAYIDTKTVPRGAFNEVMAQLKAMLETNAALKAQLEEVLAYRMNTVSVEEFNKVKGQLDEVLADKAKLQSMLGQTVADKRKITNDYKVLQEENERVKSDNTVLQGQLDNVVKEGNKALHGLVDNREEQVAELKQKQEEVAELKKQLMEANACIEKITKEKAMLEEELKECIAETPKRVKGVKNTPWEDMGISCSTYYRRKKNGTL